MPAQVSFVIPCFNHGRFVGDAVRSALGQEAVETEAIVVNDGSTDEKTARACDRLASDRVTVIHQENRGLPAARNVGAGRTAADLLVFLDADDWVEPAFCRTLMAKLEAARAAPGGEAVSHAYCQERLEDLGTGVWRVPEWDPGLLLITNLHPVTALVRRDCFEAAGGFDETMTGGYEDWDLWLKFAERGWRGVRVCEPLFVWRRHSHETMVMQVIHDHEALYRRIRDNHRAMYDRCAEETAVRMNVLLRKFDCNWIDETGYPIPLQYLWRVRDEYDSMVAVRWHHALHRTLRQLPGPLRAPVVGLMRLVKRLTPPARADQGA
ncbi:MAG: glycosyltransferase family 2 protein [Phycisphaerales bacterium JB039]